MYHPIVPAHRGFLGALPLMLTLKGGPTRDTNTIIVYEPSRRAALWLVQAAVTMYKQKVGYAPQHITLSEALYAEYCEHCGSSRYLTRDRRGPQWVQLVGSGSEDIANGDEQLICQG